MSWKNKFKFNLLLVMENNNKIIKTVLEILKLVVSALLGYVGGNAFL